MNLKKNWGSKIILSLRVGHNVLKQFLIIAIHFHNIFIHHTLTRTTRITYSEEKLQSCLKLRNFQNTFYKEYHALLEGNRGLSNYL